MITLITGTPGSGKTLYAVWLLQRELKAGRRLVVNGVKGLVLDHELISDDDARRWQECVQQNDVLVVDEVQRIWPPVAAGVKPTADIEALHVHRHMGVDLIVITQHPNRMNKTVRDLVGRHVHVRRLFGMRRAMLYEWDSARNPSAGFRDAVKTLWKYPRKVFDLYVSAEVHTKPKAVVPKALYVAPLALVVAGWFGWRALHVMAPSRFAAGHGAVRESLKAVSAPVSASESAGSHASPSKGWRLAGRVVLDGRPFVVVSGAGDGLRVVKGDSFSGDGISTEGVVDGDRVGFWTGQGPAGAVTAGGDK
jgi:zona occludens toxin